MKILFGAAFAVVLVWSGCSSANKNSADSTYVENTSGYYTNAARTNISVVPPHTQPFSK